MNSRLKCVEIPWRMSSFTQYSTLRTFLLNDIICKKRGIHTGQNIMTDQTVSKTCPQVVQNQVKWAIKPFWELEKVSKNCCFEDSVVSL